MTAHRPPAVEKPPFAGFDGAVWRFCKIYPGGFLNREYQATQRRSKARASGLLQANRPLADALTGTGFGPEIARLVAAAGLLHPVTAIRLKILLCGTDGDRFIQTAARFAAGHKNVDFKGMARLLAASDIAAWTAITVLPFLWRPFDHAFLMPRSARAFAAGAGDPFAKSYQPVLESSIYESFLDLNRSTRTRLASLRPLDYIDLQSFMWVTTQGDLSGTQYELFERLPQEPVRTQPRSSHPAPAG